MSWGLPLDVVDVVCNGHLQHRDLASLRLASSSLRAQVDQTLQQLRPACDLSQLRQLPSTFVVLASVDLSAIDMRLLSSSQLLASSGGLTRHLTVTLSQLPCLTELTISEAFAREMGRKCWAAAVCNSIFKDVVLSEQQQRQKQQQQQQQQQAAAAGHALATAVPAAPVLLPQPAQLLMAVGEAAPEAHGGDEPSLPPTAQNSQAEACAAVQEPHQPGCRFEQQQGRPQRPRQQQQQNVQGDGEVQLEGYALQLNSDPEPDDDDVDGDGETLVCHMLNPGPSCLLDCPRELMWSSGFRAYDALQFSISPAGPALSPTSTPIASPTATAAAISERHDAAKARRNDQLKDRSGPPFTSAPTKLPSRGAGGLLEGTPSLPQRQLQLHWSDDEEIEANTPLQALTASFEGGSAKLTYCAVADECVADGEQQHEQDCGLTCQCDAAGPAAPVAMQLPSRSAGAGAAAGAAAAAASASGPLCPCVVCASVEGSAASCSALTTQEGLLGQIDQTGYGGTAGSSDGEPCQKAQNESHSDGCESDTALATGTTVAEVQPGVVCIGVASSSSSSSSSGSNAVYSRAQTAFTGAVSSTSTNNGSVAMLRVQAALAAASQGGTGLHQQQQQRRRRDGDTGQTDGGSRPTTPTCSTAAVAPPASAARRSTLAEAGSASTSSAPSEEAYSSSNGSSSSSSSMSSSNTAASTICSAESAEPDPSELAYFHSAAEDPHANMSAVVWLPDWPASMPRLQALRIRSSARTTPTSGMAGNASSATVPVAAVTSGGIAAGISGLAMTTLFWARRSALCRIHMIDMSGTRLGTLPPDLLSCCLPPTLRCLRLSGCGLLGLPPSLASLTGLHELDLSCNALPQLPEQMSALTNLTCLDVSDNHLLSLVPCLGLCTALRKLNLAGNQLRNPSALPLRELAELPALAWLSLAHTWIAAPVPADAAAAAGGLLAPIVAGPAAAGDAAAAALGPASALAHVASAARPLAWAVYKPAMPASVIAPTPWLGQLLRGRVAASMVHLDLSNAGPWDQPLVLPWAACLALTALRHLNLSGNCCGLVLGPAPAEHAAVPVQLVTVSASGGMAAEGTEGTAAAARPDAEERLPLPALQLLNISQCALEELPELLSFLPHLQTLDARGNCLAALPGWTPCMAGLHHLYLAGNTDLLQAIVAPQGCDGCISEETTAWLRGVVVHQAE